MSKKIDNHPQSFISPVSQYGLLRAASPDRTVWLYGEIPWSEALLDGADNDARINAQQQFQSFFDGLASLVPMAALKYRAALKDSYREFHLLAGSLPINYHVPRSLLNTDLGRYMAEYYSDTMQNRQFAVVGVPLKAGKTVHKKGENLLQRTLTTLDSYCFSIANSFSPFEIYLEDAERIADIMRNAGIIPFSDMNSLHRQRLQTVMESWWISRPSASALPILAEYDHLHFFPNVQMANSAKKAYDNNIECSEWHLQGQYPATMCFAKTSDLHDLPLDSPSALWLAQLMSTPISGGGNAVGVSVRGKVEPAKVTADQIRRNARTIDESIRDREKKERQPTGEMIEKAQELEGQKVDYRFAGQPPTIIDTAICVCAAGDAKTAISDLSRIPAFDFVNMNTASEQLLAFKSMQPCSPIRLTPYEMHLTSTAISGSGVSSLAIAGDSSGALVGFTEANKQPVYIGTTTAASKDRQPAMLIVGDTGSGKSMLLVSLAMQWAQIKTESGANTPVVMLNPKKGDDFEDAVHAIGGTVIRLDSDIANGALDPFNVTQDPEDAKDTAVRMISDIVQANGGSAEAEITISAMIKYGMSHGAKCCGTMLQKAYTDWKQMKERGIDPNDQAESLPDNTEEVFRQISLALQSFQQLRLIFGTKEGVAPLRLSSGMTLINAGNRSLIPDSKAESSVTGRIQQWVMTMTILGMGNAMIDRDGVVIIDEAWAALIKGSKTVSIVSEWMRVARSQRYFPVLASQKVREFVDADMTGGFSRAFLLGMSDSGEEQYSPARLALKLLQIKDEYGVILNRMKTGSEMANKTALGDDEEKKKRGAPNPRSLRVLIDPNTGKAIRGAVAYFLDNDNTPVPVEIVIPEEILKQISTNREDKIRRNREKQSQDWKPVAVSK